MLTIGWLMACGGDDDEATTPDPDPTTHSTAPVPHSDEPTDEETAHSAAPVHSDSPEHTAEVPFDCTTVPASPVSTTAVVGGRGYHGLGFDQTGRMYGIDPIGNLIWADYYGNSGVAVPGLGGAQGMDQLPTGELLIALDAGRVVKIDPAAGSSVDVDTGIAYYGIVVGPDGNLYGGDRSNTYRVDLTTGVRTLFLSATESQSVGFSPDGTKFYYTTTFGYALWEVDLDVNFDPIGQPRRLADFGGGYRDSLNVDTCGNIYVNDYGTNNLFRIEPTTGAVSLYLDYTFDRYGHGGMFGSGVGGFRTDALYVPQPYNGYTVAEIVVGVDGIF